MGTRRQDGSLSYEVLNYDPRAAIPAAASPWCPSPRQTTSIPIREKAYSTKSRALPNGESKHRLTVVGVLPASFDFAPRGGTEFWLPFHAKGSCDLQRSCHGLEGIARLKDGVTMQGALAEMKNVAAELERQYPDSNRGQGAAIAVAGSHMLRDWLRGLDHLHEIQVANRLLLEATHHLFKDVERLALVLHQRIVLPVAA